MIHLRGITQTYQGSQGPVEALRGIDLQITPGEVFGIIGALLHKSAIGQGIPNPKKIYAAATVWGVPRSVN
jgi:ABC-type dipeptide/oligopeptide/nickel transport system ATPase component